MTKAEIMQKLDADGIKYDPKANKADLEALLSQGMANRPGYVMRDGKPRKA